MINETKIIDVSSWESLPYSAVPIGKRVKYTIVDPENNSTFYFKEPKTNYPWEHWTEIASSKIGAFLGFDVLDYNIGVNGSTIGCLSKSMIEKDEELIHGQQFLTQIIPKFEKKKGSDHSFQLIQAVFDKNPKISHIFDDFLKMLVFDSIIGNHDRHQQNWGIIRSVIIKGKIDAKTFNDRLTIWNLLKTLLFKKSPLNDLLDSIQVEETYKFTPLFDNGNCLAYNILDSKIETFLTTEKINSYAFGKKATSHIRWQGEIKTHLELLQLIQNLSPNYAEKIKGIILSVLKTYSEEHVNSIIHTLDKSFNCLEHKIFELTLQRKELMCKLIRLRVDQMRSLAEL